MRGAAGNLRRRTLGAVSVGVFVGVFAGGLVVGLVGGLLGGHGFPRAAAGHEPELSRYTYWGEVRPLLERECASCHSGEGPAPVNLMRYADALPWANSIAREILERRMPPWLPEDGAGALAHARTLDERETDLLVDWAIGLAPEGRPPGDAGERGSEEGADEAAGRAVRAGSAAAPPVGKLRAESPVVVGAEISEAERCVPLLREGAVAENAAGFSFDPGGAAPILRRAVLLRGGCEEGVPVFTWVVGQGVRRRPPGVHDPLPPDEPLHLRLRYRKGFDTEGLSFRHRPEVTVHAAPPAPGAPVETVALEAGNTRLDGVLLAVFPPEDLGVGSATDSAPGGPAFTVDAVGPAGEVTTLLRIRRFDRDWAEKFFFREPVRLAPGVVVRASHAGAFLDLARPGAAAASDGE